MVKPDGVQRKLVGEVIGRLEKKGLQPVAIKMMQIDPELASRHYGCLLYTSSIQHGLCL